MNTNTEKNETTITPHIFGENLVRTTTKDGQILFCGKDVCSCLQIINARDALSSLREDEKGVGITDTLGGEQSMTYVTEPGLYRLIFKSRKAEAEIFKRWVFHEVLPAIRRNGVYGKRSTETVAFIKEMIALGMTAKDANILARHTFPPMTRKEAKLESQTYEQPKDISAPMRDELEILALLDNGKDYTIPEILSLLPRDHRAWLPSSVRGRYTIIGGIMTALLTLKKVEKVSKRHGIYRRISETSNIIQIK